jgi:hypothetical protein
MYCSFCGVAVTKGLSYCNQCGSKLNANENVEKSPGLTPGLLLPAMVATFILGMVVITALMGVMKVILDLPVDAILILTSVPFLLMLVLEAIFIRLFLRRTRDTTTAQDSLGAQQRKTNELDEAHTRSLHEPIASVTEHTTRAFEPIYHDRLPK